MVLEVFCWGDEFWILIFVLLTVFEFLLLLLVKFLIFDKVFFIIEEIIWLVVFRILVEFLINDKFCKFGNFMFFISFVFFILLFVEFLKWEDINWIFFFFFLGFEGVVFLFDNWFFKEGIWFKFLVNFDLMFELFVVRRKINLILKLLVDLYISTIDIFSWCF